MKSCPYCLEEVKEGAVKCRHCHSTLPAEEGAATDDKPWTISIDQRFKSSTVLLGSILSAMVVIALIGFGVDLKEMHKTFEEQSEANLEAREGIQNTREAASALLEDTKKTVAEAAKLVEDLNARTVESQEQVSKITEKLATLAGGTERGDSLQNALVAISEVQKSISFLDERVKSIEAGTKSTLGVPSGEPAEADRPALEAAIRVHQKVSPVPEDTDAATSTPNRKFYILEYTVIVDDTKFTQPQRGNDVIEKVVYRRDKTWFSTPEIVSIDRANDFPMSIRVWGSTLVEVDIFVKGLEQPIHRKRLMDLTQSATF